MATIHKVDQKRQADRRTALLGLAADQPASAGVCPTSEEMAELVENFPTEKKEQFLRHIAVCEFCYREWLDLQDVLDKRLEEKKRPKILTFLKPRNMALWGTLLAAAASLVVFLNIHLPMNTSHIAPMEPVKQEPSFIGREEEKSLPPLQEERKEPTPAPVKSAIKSETLQKNQQVRVLTDTVKTKKSIPSSPSVMPPVPVSLLKEDLQEKGGISAEQALPKDSGENAAAGGVRSRAGGMTPVLRQNSLQAGPAIFGKWRRQVEDGCRKARSSEAFWQAMERKGLEVKARSGELQSEERENLENLLLLISGMEKENLPERCRKIKALLAEARKGR